MHHVGIRVMIIALLVACGSSGSSSSDGGEPDGGTADGGTSDGARPDARGPSCPVDGAVDRQPLAASCAEHGDCESGLCFGACLAAEAEALVTDAEDHVGTFGAAFDADATTLVVGTPTEVACHDDEGPDCTRTGVVRVYERVAGGWELRDRLVAVRDGKDDFGSVIAIDGDVLAVSAPSYQSCEPDELDCQNHGRVVVFERRGSTWEQTAILVASDHAEFQAFGGSLAIAGGQIFVGAVGDRPCGDASADEFCVDTGAVYVFERSCDGWHQVEKLKPATAGDGDGIGFSIDVDGDTLAVGAPGRTGCVSGVGEEAPFDTCNTAGAVFMYERGEERWQERDLILFRRDLLPTFNGRDVELSGDVLAVAGASGGNCPGADAESCVHQGIVIVFERTVGGWEQTAVLESGVDGLIHFANHIAASGDELAVATVHRPAGAEHDHLSIELFRRGGDEWTRVGAVSPHPAPFPAAINLQGLRIEEAGLLISTPRAPGCTTDDDPCRVGGTVVTWPAE